MIILYYSVIVLWVFFEIFLSILLRSGKSGDATFDRGSIFIIWAVIVLSVFLGVYAGSRWGYRSRACLYSGTGVIVIGMAVRIFAILSLRKAFTTTIAIRQDHHLKTDGLYHWVRHPSYLGSLISFLGLGISAGNWLSIALFVLPTTGVFLYRISLEEDMLLRHFGKEYEAYKASTKKLLPFLY